MDDVEVPQYFICPISLQIMKDPVTMVTGITYDRESIEQWLSSDTNATCPLTKQLLPTDSDLTPNHTLRRLIQAWCTINAANGIDRIPTPKSPLNKFHVLKLLQDLCVQNDLNLQLQYLKKLEGLANENERNRRAMIQAGAPRALMSMMVTCFKKDRSLGVEEVLNILNMIRFPSDETTLFSVQNYDFMESIMWVLRCCDDKAVEMKTRVVKDGVSHLVTKAALHVMLCACPWGRNKMKLIEVDAVFDLIELELNSSDKRTTELIFGILDYLCSCADGRAKFVGHSAGIAMVSKRILRVSPATDDLAVRIIASICKFSGTQEVIHEMLRVGAASKLCMVLQAESSANTKDKARGVLRLHSNVWSNSPCIHVYLLTRYPR
ncbi:hypothetical protein GIB67_035366 [Kingdonia uniflora]|uniref:U-box domain-containing protein n=1 Tax=Kingdonia uniflora TaxID=39325 RepID=A0A7J7MM68_9MAGN|nr:hypothetical protein GIB67_035366 [Kingdonia uniflora]